MPGAKSFSVEIRKFYTNNIGVTGITNDHLAICANNSNTFILKKNDTGYANVLAHDVTAMGMLAVSGESHLMDNVFVYPKAFITSPKGNFTTRNEAFGYKALGSLPNSNSATDNIAVGYYTMHNVTGSSTSSNIAIGNRALAISGAHTIQSNIIVGHYSSSMYLNDDNDIDGKAFSISNSIVLGSGSVYVDKNSSNNYIFNGLIVIGKGSAIELKNFSSGNNNNVVTDSIVLGNDSCKYFVGKNNIVIGHKSFNLESNQNNIVDYDDTQNIILGNNILQNKYYKKDNQGVFNNVNNVILGFNIKSKQSNDSNLKNNLVSNIIIANEFLNKSNNNEKTQLWRNIILTRDSFSDVLNQINSYFGNNVVIANGSFNKYENVINFQSNVIIGQDVISFISQSNPSLSNVFNSVVIGTNNIRKVSGDIQKIIVIGSDSCAVSSISVSSLGEENISIGFSNLQYIEAGAKKNISIGSSCLQNHTSGSYNIGIGYNCLKQMKNGADNIAIGKNVLDLASNDLNSEIKENIVIGFESLQKNKKSSNIAIGPKVLKENSEGANNICIGVYSMVNSASGTNNICLGVNNMINVSGNDHICIGNNIITGANTVDTWANIAIGNNSLSSINKGSSNVTIGLYSLNKYKKCNNNIAIGFNALQGTSGSSEKEINANIAIGLNSAIDISGDHNIALGTSSLNKTQGSYNIAIGNNSAFSLNPSANDCYYNVIIGYQAGLNANISYSNVCIGTECATAAGGNHNIILGYRTATELNGSANVVLGDEAGLKSKYSNSIIIGTKAAQNVNTDGNCNIILGYGAVSGSNCKLAYNNISIGTECATAASGNHNIILGYRTATELNGSANVVLGDEAGSSVSGNNNIFLGLKSGKSLKNSSGNIVIGPGEASNGGLSFLTGEVAFNIFLGNNFSEDYNNINPVNGSFQKNIIIGISNGKRFFQNENINNNQFFCNENIILGNNNLRSADLFNTANNNNFSTIKNNIIFGNSNITHGIYTPPVSSGTIIQGGNIIIGCFNIHSDQGQFSAKIDGGLSNVIIGNKNFYADNNNNVYFDLKGNKNIFIGNEFSFSDICVLQNDYYEYNENERVFIKITKNTGWNQNLGGYSTHNLKITNKFEIIKDSSTRKIKTNIEPMYESEIEKVYNLQPVYYRLKDKNNNASQWSFYGFIAEDVAEVEPRLVGWDFDEEDYEFVDHTIIREEDISFSDDKIIKLYFNNDIVKNIICINNNFYINEDYHNSSSILESSGANITGNNVSGNNESVSGTNNLSCHYNENIEYFDDNNNETYYRIKDFNIFYRKNIQKLEYIDQRFNIINKIINNVVQIEKKNDNVLTIKYEDTVKTKKLKPGAQLKPVSVYYDRITTHLVGVVKIQRRRINELELKVNELETKVSNLENEIQNIKGQLLTILQSISGN